MVIPIAKDTPLITEIENFKVVVPWPQEEVEAGVLNQFDMVRIRTDSGITGYATGRPPIARSISTRMMRSSTTALRRARIRVSTR
jgi:hypothetical protein